MFEGIHSLIMGESFESLDENFEGCVSYLIRYRSWAYDLCVGALRYRSGSRKDPR